jgi:peptidoglycan/LPS O-acetylase OafA/YrhL
MLVGVPLLRRFGVLEDASQSWLQAIAYFAAATVLTLLCSALSYHVLEMPFLKLKRLFVAKPAS